MGVRAALPSTAFSLMQTRDAEAMGLTIQKLLPVEECFLAEHLNKDSG
jgi:hypothetical protein